MQQNARTREVFQEANAEARAFRRTSDQARNVGDDETLVFGDADDAEVRVHGGERVIGNLRARRRDRTNEGALASVRQPEQADVGEYAQLQAQIALFAGLALGALARRTVDTRLEVDVAETTIATLGDENPFPVDIEVGDHFAAVFVGNHRTDRDVQNDVFTALAVTILAGAVFATLRKKFAGVAKLDQGVEIAVGDDKNIATTAAIATTRAAFRLVLFAPERGDTVTAVAGGDIDFRLVDKFHCRLFLEFQTLKIKKALPR